MKKVIKSKSKQKSEKKQTLKNHEETNKIVNFGLEQIEKVEKDPQKRVLESLKLEFFDSVIADIITGIKQMVSIVTSETRRIPRYDPRTYIFFINKEGGLEVDAHIVPGVALNGWELLDAHMNTMATLTYFKEKKDQSKFILYSFISLAEACVDTSDGTNITEGVGVQLKTASGHSRLLFFEVEPKASEADPNHFSFSLRETVHDTGWIRGNCPVEIKADGKKELVVEKMWNKYSFIRLFEDSSNWLPKK